MSGRGDCGRAVKLPVTLPGYNLTMMSLVVSGRTAVTAVLLLVVAGCANGGVAPVDDIVTGSLTGIATDAPPKETALEALESGNYGIAEREYRAILTQTPDDIDAWLGLAAAYDNLGRFDMADAAYDEALKLGERRAEVMNNQGYSFYLRGERKRALETLRAAARLAPDDDTIRGNIALVSSKS